MDYQFEMQWKDTLKRIESHFVDDVDLEKSLMLIGIQELGQGIRKFKKDEKMNLMHIALCTLLEPYGYYESMGRDDDGWPHFKRLKDLPPLNADQQDRLIKEAVMEYFDSAIPQ